MGDAERCRHCGRCMLGCPYGRKWDSRTFVDEAVARGARLVTGCEVTEVVTEGGRATGVLARGGALQRFIPADLVVVAAGGFATPSILARSGIACEPTLFVDPVLTVAARTRTPGRSIGIEMPFVMQREGYILSPYFDWMSSLFHPRWRHRLQDIAGIMIKLADENVGSVSGRKVDKLLTPADRARLDVAVGVATKTWPASVPTRTRSSWGPCTPVTPAGCFRSPRRPFPRFTTTGFRRTSSWPMPRSCPGRSATHRSSRSSRWRSVSPGSVRNGSSPREQRVGRRFPDPTPNGSPIDDRLARRSVRPVHPDLRTTHGLRGRRSSDTRSEERRSLTLGLEMAGRRRQSSAGEATQPPGVAPSPDRRH